jgi:hypothetical protein
VTAPPDLDEAVSRYDHAVSRYLNAALGGGQHEIYDAAREVADAARAVQAVAYAWYDLIKAEQSENSANATLAGIEIPFFSSSEESVSRYLDAVRREDRSKIERSGSELAAAVRSWQLAARQLRAKAAHSEDGADVVRASIEPRATANDETGRAARAHADRMWRLGERFPLVGPKEDFDRLVDEYGWSSADLEHHILVESSHGAPCSEYHVHRSLLRAHPPFDGAGDAKAARFCEEIADHMTENFGISRDEAVARINWHWPGNRRRPTVWIVGTDIAYHQDPATWAAHMYYGRDSSWWLPDANPTPLPPPPA